MKNNFDTIGTVIEHLHTSNLIKNWIVVVVSHVVSRDGWKLVTLERKDAAFEKDFIFIGKEVVGRWESAMFTTAI